MRGSFQAMVACIVLNSVTFGTPVQTGTVDSKYSSPEVAAFAQWTMELNEVADGGICPAQFTEHYSENATLTFQRWGTEVYRQEGGSYASTALCNLFTFTEDAPAMTMEIEHCNGVWRGAFMPFFDGTANPDGTGITWNYFNAVSSELETYPRAFVIHGTYNKDGTGKFQADKDVTCLGQCLVDYEWSCDGGPQAAIERWPVGSSAELTQYYSQDQIDFTDWAIQLNYAPIGGICPSQKIHDYDYSNVDSMTRSRNSYQPQMPALWTEGNVASMTGVCMNLHSCEFPASNIGKHVRQNRTAAHACDIPLWYVPSPNTLIASGNRSRAQELQDHVSLAFWCCQWPPGTIYGARLS